MQLNLKEIHIGKLIQKRVAETQTSTERIVNLFKCTDNEVDKMYKMKDMDSGLMLKWSKLLKYDFFRIYSQHLILYRPPGPVAASHKEESMDSINTTEPLPHFKKNIYTKEIIDFVLELIDTEEKTKRQIIEEYKIPKTTLYKWISKYRPEG